MEPIIVERQSVWSLIILFVGYIAFHAAFMMKHKAIIRELEKDKDSEELKFQEKVWGYVSYWFPFAYVILILIIFYF